MSLKETLGLRSHREDPKMFWFEMTLLLLVLGVAAALLALLRLQGTTGMAVRVVRGAALSGAFVCALLTEAVGHRKKDAVSIRQIQMENLLLLLSMVLALLQELLLLFPGARYTGPMAVMGAALYFMARIALPRSEAKERFTTREILLVMGCGLLAFGLLVPFLDMAMEIISAL